MANSLFSDLPEAPARPDLPPIRAKSDDQRRFAESQRPRMLQAAERAVTEQSRLADVREAAGRAGAPGERAKARRWFDAYARLEQEDRAWYWLDRRELSGAELLERVARESEGACGEQVHPRPGRREGAP